MRRVAHTCASHIPHTNTTTYNTSNITIDIYSVWQGVFTQVIKGHIPVLLEIKECIFTPLDLAGEISDASGLSINSYSMCCKPLFTNYLNLVKKSNQLL